MKCSFVEAFELLSAVWWCAELLGSTTAAIWSTLPSVMWWCAELLGSTTAAIWSTQTDTTIGSALLGVEVLLLLRVFVVAGTRIAASIVARGMEALLRLKLEGMRGQVRSLHEPLHLGWQERQHQQFCLHGTASGKPTVHGLSTYVIDEVTFTPVLSWMTSLSAHIPRLRVAGPYGFEGRVLGIFSVERQGEGFVTTNHLKMGASWKYDVRRGKLVVWLVSCWLEVGELSFSEALCPFKSKIETKVREELAEAARLAKKQLGERLNAELSQYSFGAALEYVIMLCVRWPGQVFVWDLQGYVRGLYSYPVAVGLMMYIVNFF